MLMLEYRVVPLIISTVKAVRSLLFCTYKRAWLSQKAHQYVRHRLSSLGLADFRNLCLLYPYLLFPEPNLFFIESLRRRTMIEIENVSFYYQGNEQMGAVNHLSLSIPKGQVVVLCGESGCGKTTVTRLMNGLIPNFL